MSALSQKNNYVLEIKTVQISAVRTLMTALKDILLKNKYQFSGRWFKNSQHG